LDCNQKRQAIREVWLGAQLGLQHSQGCWLSSNHKGQVAGDAKGFKFLAELLRTPWRERSDEDKKLLQQCTKACAEWLCDRADVVSVACITIYISSQTLAGEHQQAKNSKLLLPDHLLPSLNLVLDETLSHPPSRPNHSIRSARYRLYTPNPPLELDHAGITSTLDHLLS
jgi:hypothetical protein